MERFTVNRALKKGEKTLNDFTTDYICIIVGHHQGSDKKYVWRAPKFSDIQVGDLVLVDTKNGEAVVVVDAVSNLDTNGEAGLITTYLDTDLQGIRVVIGVYKLKKMRW